MLLASNDIDYLIGKGDMGFNVRTLKPYDELICDFLNDLSLDLISNKKAKLYPDVISFAFWCRRANINKLKSEFNNRYIRLGIGLVFHITPSNVPINFAFSYVFSLLAGNANIVRVPSKDFPQTDIVCTTIRNILKNEKYKGISEMTAFVKYSQNEEISSYFSSICNARIIWGGDEAIRNIRKLPVNERSIEVAFADRYSFSVISIDEILNTSEKELEKLASNFYNDTFLMDQNACSSPQLIIWLGDREKLSDAKEKFWKSIYNFSTSKYNLQPVNVVDKYTLVCENAIDLDIIDGYKRYGNYIYMIEINELSNDVDKLRGKFGYFYEYCTNDINNVAHMVNNKFQTLTYYGVDKSILLDFVLLNSLNGIDRIVQIGSALDISVVWDGYDIVGCLSRIIDIK